MIRGATYGQGYLNRQIITLLYCLGVPESYFLNMQRKAKEYASVNAISAKFTGNKMSKRLTKKDEVQILQSLEEQEPIEEGLENLKVVLMGSRILANCVQTAARKRLDLLAEPVFSSVLYGLQLSNYLNLKKKARILVPDSATLIGVADDEGILQDDEVFIQIRRDNFSEKKVYMGQGSEILKGQILVTRNPCTHPGDLRLLKAVDRPELRHLTNVVVFPTRGNRPLCNMMAGGDLDGDVYFVCWDRELMQHLRPEIMEPPAKYQKPEFIKEKPKGDTLADYFVFYLERDVLGKLANLHLALCD